MWVTADLRAFTRVWMVDGTMGSAIDDGLITLHGRTALARKFPQWLRRHPVLGAIDEAVEPP